VQNVRIRQKNNHKQQTLQIAADGGNVAQIKHRHHQISVCFWRKKKDVKTTKIVFSNKKTPVTSVL
jgi:hypothetical protein